jgi:hypothetical protein
MRWGPTRIIAVPKTVSTSRRDLAHKSKMEKEALLDWLSWENPLPVDLLRRLSECSTPYARLLLRACEEMVHSLGPVRSDMLDDVEHNASLTCAKLEVEIEQQHERVVRMNNEARQLEDELSTLQKQLDQLNEDIDRIQKLSIIHKVNEIKEKPKPTEDWSKFEDAVEPTIQLDDKMYQELWVEQQALTETTIRMQEQLAQKQETQIEEMKRYIRRRYPQFSTVR